ncbi:MAG: 16S rRNA (cytosine(1402)-N(4))-methyltransferase RsmH [Planctomycetota bacterium]
MSTVHIPVLPDEVVEWLIPQDARDSELTLVDGTLGGGGHTRLLLEAMGGRGKLISVDRDSEAVEKTRALLSAELDAEILRPWRSTAANYSDLPEIINSIDDVDKVDGILLDVGLSSDQLADHDRGFSYNAAGALDLRFDRNSGEPASRLVNRLGEKHLADIIYRYGEERYSRRVARNICKARHEQKIATAEQLADIVRRSVPRSRGHNIDPATRTFQALRIAVNEELKWLQVAVSRLPEVLSPMGRLAIISFHSLEDRIVKNGFNESTSLNVLTRRPVKPSEEEIDRNPRSRSARLRVAERR